MITPDGIWKKALESLESTMNVYSFDVWIKPLRAINIEGNKLIISAPTNYSYNIIIKNYYSYIKEAIEKQNLFVNDVELTSDEIISQNEPEITPAATEITKPQVAEKGISLNPRYTFDSFIVGDSNRLVYTAAKEVAKNPGAAKFNPLFIYGGVGLGKTHIMHAIGNYIKNQFPDKNLIYTTSEKFTNEFINSLRSDKKNDPQLFKDSYRNCDVLMIDDVQFFENKQSTQEELFNTFNELYNENKQLIFTCDRIPREIPTLEERLRTRFEWGIIADIQPPSIETKIAILQKKSEEELYEMPNDVIEMIAERVESNIREMEGLLSRVALYSKMLEKDVTMDLAKEALKDYSDHRQAQMSADTIIDAVCTYYNIDKNDLTGKRKTKEIVEPRQVAMFLILEFLSLPLVAVGKIFGGRDYTTVIHARDKISEDLKTNKKLIVQVNDIRNMIKGN